MAFQINTTTVISDTRALNNIAELDATSATSIAAALMQQNTIAPGTTVRASRDTEVARSGALFINHSFWSFIQKGTVNFSFEGRVDDASGPGSARIVRNRNGATSTVISQSLTSTTYTAYNTDQSVLPGDIFFFDVRGGAYSIGTGKNSYSISTTGLLRNVRLRTSTGTVYIPGAGTSGSYFWYTAGY
jgi:hypothetical protein